MDNGRCTRICDVIVSGEILPLPLYINDVRPPISSSIVTDVDLEGELGPVSTSGPVDGGGGVAER
ncbi:hypothetical protein RHGRI_025532 [Rhododendron griersonianum]|uniref:Uncharacterized protein n=1 Tax=Rhododendron griersonianum TaxID=479676 RepID=A0AAV6ITY2_9ERIC|nr:hypothetical protein RHGRI_025532 [Rhododendron griersonianum]